MANDDEVKVDVAFTAYVEGTRDQVRAERAIRVALKEAMSIDGMKICCHCITINIDGGGE